MKKENLIITILTVVSLVGITSASVIGREVRKDKVKVEVVSGNLDELDNTKLVYTNYMNKSKSINTVISSDGITKNSDDLGRNPSLWSYSEVGIRSVINRGRYNNNLHIKVNLLKERLDLSMSYIDKSKKDKDISIDIEILKNILGVKSVDYIQIYMAREYGDTLKILCDVGTKKNINGVETMVGVGYRLLNINLNTFEVDEVKEARNITARSPLYLSEKYLYVEGREESNGYDDSIVRYDINDISKFKVFKYESCDVINSGKKLVLYNNTEKSEYQNIDISIINMKTDDTLEYKNVDLFTEEESKKYMLNHINAFDDKIVINYFKNNNSAEILDDGESFTRILDLKTNEIVLELKSNTGNDYIEVIDY